MTPVAWPRVPRKSDGECCCPYPCPSCSGNPPDQVQAVLSGGAGYVANCDCDWLNGTYLLDFEYVSGFNACRGNTVRPTCAWRYYFPSVTASCQDAFSNNLNYMEFLYFHSALPMNWRFGMRFDAQVSDDFVLVEQASSTECPDTEPCTYVGDNNWVFTSAGWASSPWQCTTNPTVTISLP